MRLRRAPADPGADPETVRGGPRGGGIARALSSAACLAAILALAAALRLAHVSALKALPLFDRLILDSELYDAWARRIASGDWLGGDRAFFFDPLYSYFLAAIYRVAGHDLLAVRLVQAGLGVATCALAAWIGRRVAGRGAGNLAALLLALYKPAIYQEGEIEKTALGVFLLTAALALFMTKTIPRRLAAGACLGLAALTRGNLLLLAPLGALYLLADPEADGGKPSAARWRERLSGRPTLSASAFLLGLALALAPAAWRNRHVSGEWILTTSGAGANFYIGNNPANRSGGFQNVPFVRPQSGHEEEDFRAEAERRTGRPMGPSELSSFWFREGLRHVAGSPAFSVGVTLKKTVLFWSDLELPDAWDMYFLSRYSPVLALPLPGMGVLVALGALGAVLCWRDKREVRLLAGFSLAYFLSVLPFFVFSRFRLHVVPALAVLAALGLVRLLEGGAARRRVTAGAAAGLALGLFSFLGVRAVGMKPAEAIQSSVYLAEMYQERGDFRAAGRVLDEALARDPARAMTRCALGKLRLRSGDPGSALREFERCLEADPGYPDAWFLVGLARDALREPTLAAEAYRKQLASVPGHLEADRRLGEAEIRMGAYAEGIERLTRAGLRGGDGPELRLSLAAALLRAGRAAEARALLSDAEARGWAVSDEALERETARLFGRPR